ncbi:hypothetical protein [Nocardiopsis coralliicola]
MNHIKRVLIGSAIAIPACFALSGTAAADTDVFVNDAEFSSEYSEAFGAAYAPAGFALGHTVDHDVSAEQQTVGVSTR